MLAAAISAGCNDLAGLGDPAYENRVDTLTLYAVNGTPLWTPSAYLLATKTTYHLGIETLPYDFDFLYRIDPEGPVFVPFGAFEPDSTQTGLPGFIPTTEAFDAIGDGQQGGYVTGEPMPLEVGRVLFARSGLPNGCSLEIPYYAKMEVLSLDQETRSVRFRILTNNNCGFRGLLPGYPER
jgi:hypothetical protein